MQANKIALITGGSRGLGRNAALKMAEKGINTIITYNTNQAAAQETVAELERYGVKAAAFRLNTGDTKEFPAFVSDISAYLHQEFGVEKFDFLINNAGSGGHAPFENTTEEYFDTMVNVHYKGVFFLTQKLLPLLNDGGAIINVSTGLARFSHPNTAAYAAAKGAVEVLSRILAVELGPRKIRVNTVAPGAVATDFNGGTVRDNAHVNQMVAGITALGRAGVPDDIGGVVAFLCSEDARWITGQRIEVSGGMHL